MTQDRDFIITGLQPWEIAIGSNAKDIALEISKKNRVLYVNTPLDWITLYKKDNNETIHRKQVIRKQTASLRLIKNNLWVLDFPFPIYPINKLPDGCIFEFINYINNKKMCHFINETAQQLGFTNTIQLIDNDIYRSFYNKEFIKPSLSIYYRRDNLLAIPFWKKHATRLEPLIIKKSDLVLTNSEELAQHAQQFNTNCYNIGQGIDLKAYDYTIPQTTPKDIIPIPRPIIGYIGSITSQRLNAELIYNLAKSKPNYAFVLIGPEDVFFKNHALHQLKNVYFLGNKRLEEVVSYISSCDVCINPQAVNDTTIGNYPRKIDEYLALGKPILATRTSTMELFKNQVYLCSNIEDYKQNLDKAIHSISKEEINQRIQFAKKHSWPNCVSKLYQYIASTELQIKNEK